MCQMSYSLRSAIALVTLMGLTLLVAGCAPAASPGDPTATPASTPVSQTPPGDCWGGALPEDGVHCYVLEQSQMEGAIKVVAIYEAPNDVLHMFLARTAPLDDSLRILFREKATKFLGEGKGIARRVFDWNNFRDGTLRGRLVPPYMKGYGQAFLYVGGLDALQSVPGWASWTRLWPEAPDASVSVRHDPGSGRVFDVSDIDTGRIPDPNCDELVSRIACNMWRRNPDSGVAGYHVEILSRESTTLAYIQIKETFLPQSEEEQESLKQRLLPGDELFWIDDVTLIPVKYNYWELWSWATILNRFAVSAANTIGIVRADVDTNTVGRGSHIFPDIFPLDGWDLAEPGDASAVRETVGIVASDASTVTEALPELLPLLGIPVDAVGIVRTIVERYIEAVPE